jgi:hypothetical protein
MVKQMIIRLKPNNLNNIVVKNDLEEGIEKEDELEQLIAELIPLGFTHSNQVSKYIIQNKLGYKYRNISGIVKMKQDDDTWDFRGGFPNNIYAEICKRLGLKDQNSKAKAVGFKSFKDMGE